MIRISRQILSFTKVRNPAVQLLEREGLPQLLVDVSTIRRHDAGTGIQRVVRGLLNQLMIAGVPGYVVRPVFATADHGYRYCDTNFPCSSDGPLPAENCGAIACGRGDIFFGLDLCAHLLPRHEAQIVEMKQQGVSVALLVHDLLPVRHSKWFNRRSVRHFTRWLGLLERRCDIAICVSRTTERDLLDWMSARRNVRTDIATAVLRLSGFFGGPLTVVNDLSVVLPPLARQAFHLMVGTIEPRKGHEAVLDAYERLWRTDPDTPALIVVGRPGWKTDSLQARLRRVERSTGRLCWLNDANDEVLAALYRQCRGVVVASYAEGFGLPLEEAARFGKPILARDLPVYHEAGRSGNLTTFTHDRYLAGAVQDWDRHNDVEAVADQASPVGWDATLADLLSGLRIPAQPESGLGAAA